MGRTTSKNKEIIAFSLKNAARKLEEASSPFEKWMYKVLVALYDLIAGNQFITDLQEYAPMTTDLIIDFDKGSIVKLDTSFVGGNIDVEFVNAEQATTYLIEVNQGNTPRNITFPSNIISTEGGGNSYTASGANQTDLIALMYN